MGLVLVCPQCQATVELWAQKCQYCQADLRNLPKDQRRYVTGTPGPATSPGAAAPEAIPVLESAGVPETIAPAPQAAGVVGGRVRRPYIRRYAGLPVSVTHPVAVHTAAAPEPAAEPKKGKKAKSTGKKKK